MKATQIYHNILRECFISPFLVENAVVDLCIDERHFRSFNTLNFLEHLDTWFEKSGRYLYTKIIRGNIYLHSSGKRVNKSVGEIYYSLLPGKETEWEQKNLIDFVYCQI